MSLPTELYAKIFENVPEVDCFMFATTTGSINAIDALMIKLSSQGNLHKALRTFLNKIGRCLQASSECDKYVVDQLVMLLHRAISAAKLPYFLNKFETFDVEVNYHMNEKLSILLSDDRKIVHAESTERNMDKFVMLLQMNIYLFAKNPSRLKNMVAQKTFENEINAVIHDKNLSSAYREQIFCVLNRSREPQAIIGLVQSKITFFDKIMQTCAKDHFNTCVSSSVSNNCTFELTPSLKYLLFTSGAFKNFVNTVDYASKLICYVDDMSDEDVRYLLERFIALDMCDWKALQLTGRARYTELVVEHLLKTEIFDANDLRRFIFKMCCNWKILEAMERICEKYNLNLVPDPYGYECEFMSYDDTGEEYLDYEFNMYPHEYYGEDFELSHNFSSGYQMDCHLRKAAITFVLGNIDSGKILWFIDRWKVTRDEVCDKCNLVISYMLQQDAWDSLNIVMKKFKLDKTCLPIECNRVLWEFLDLNDLDKAARIISFFDYDLASSATAKSIMYLRDKNSDHYMSKPDDEMFEWFKNQGVSPQLNIAEMQIPFVCECGNFEVTKIDFCADPFMLHIYRSGDDVFDSE